MCALCHAVLGFVCVSVQRTFFNNIATLCCLLLLLLLLLSVVEVTVFLHDISIEYPYFLYFPVLR